MFDFLRRLLFESPVLLLVFELIAVAMAVAVHRRRYTASTRRGIWITIGICALLLGIQWAVVTDYEALETMIREMARAVDAGDIGGLGEHIDEEFNTAGWDKAELLWRANATLQRWSVDEAKPGAFQITVEGDQATVSFRVFCDLRSPDVTQYAMLSRWRVACIRRPAGWKLLDILVAKLGPAALGGDGGFDILRNLD